MSKYYRVYSNQRPVYAILYSLASARIMFNNNLFEEGKSIKKVLYTIHNRMRLRYR